ncbi:type IV toxin-antitoxin system AbiEi family antitoxin domain-containing protein [Cellulomonas sp.]|uniref:type IV toxin-antitoxin system AbiEi family antitoxin domain-containing protein n=1 Tax=Cellulomonas sp. TaxID=40001 RepID=UPI0035C74137
MAPAPSLPPDLRALARAQADLVSTAQCDAAGVGRGRRGRLVSDGLWQRVVRGVYDVRPEGSRAPHELRRRAAWTGLLAYGPGAVAVGACALALHDVAGLPSGTAPEVALPGGRYAPGRDGVRVRRFDVVGVRVGSALAAPLPVALVQALPELPRDHAVAVLDDVLRRRRLTVAELRAVRAAVVGRRGAARTRGWWDLVDPRAESPLETFARLQCVDGGVPPDELQHVVRGRDGALVARCDLGWRRRDGSWVLGEVDGREFHDVPAALLHDRRRQNALAVLGHTVLRFTAADVARRRVAPVVRAALTAWTRP